MAKFKRLGVFVFLELGSFIVSICSSGWLWAKLRLSGNLDPSWDNDPKWDNKHQMGQGLLQAFLITTDPLRYIHLQTRIRSPLSQYLFFSQSQI